MKNRAKILALATAIGFIVASGAHADDQSKWLTSAQYQQVFNKQVRDGFYPEKVEGRCENGSEQFRAAWNGIPLDVTFVAHHAMTKQFYEGKNLKYGSLGYSLESANQFMDCSGMERYQAVWLKKSQSTK